MSKRQTTLRPAQGGKIHRKVDPNLAPCPGVGTRATRGDWGGYNADARKRREDDTSRKLAEDENFRREMIRNYERNRYNHRNSLDQLTHSVRQKKILEAQANNLRAQIDQLEKDLEAAVLAKETNPLRLLETWAANRGLSVDRESCGPTLLLVDEQGRHAGELSNMMLQATPWPKVRDLIEDGLIPEDERPPSKGRDAIANEFIWLVTELGIKAEEIDGFNFSHVRDVLRKQVAYLKRGRRPFTEREDSMRGEILAAIDNLVNTEPVGRVFGVVGGQDLIDAASMLESTGKMCPNALLVIHERCPQSAFPIGNAHRAEMCMAPLGQPPLELQSVWAKVEDS